MSEWTIDVPTEGSVELPPDPRAMEAIGRNHSLETALADLVDNSIDAGASHVLIRLVRSARTLRSLYVVDNGRGMSAGQIDRAMTVGGNQTYRADALGHFGVGLKAASFSQAQSLTVMSRSSGSRAVGRQWKLSELTSRHSCGVVSEEFAERELRGDWGIPWSDTGTVVRWDALNAFPTGDEPDRLEEFIANTLGTVSEHLGLVFHRFLQQSKVSVLFEVADMGHEGVRTRIAVKPIDPFGYLRSAHPDFPQTLTAIDGDRRIDFQCHIWPGRSTIREFRLPGGAVERQGLYFYRRDRLLQAGGWDGIHTRQPNLQLARVAVEITDDLQDLFRMNPEKSRVSVGPEFGPLSARAQSSSGLTFSRFLDKAEQLFKKSRERNKERKAMIHPGVGFPTRVRDAIKTEIPEARGFDPIDIRWCDFDTELLFDVDRERHTLWLNKKYRKMLLGGKRGGLNDLPLLKTLLYLLVEKVYRGEYLGPRDKDNLELWQELLTAAVQAERQ